jgi:hypothetical protein
MINIRDVTVDIRKQCSYWLCEILLGYVVEYDISSSTGKCKRDISHEAVDVLMPSL